MSTKAIVDTSLRVGRRHRSWPEVLKREIVAASLAPGASVSVVARRYDVNSNLVFSWRKRYGEAPTAAPPQLMPVVVTPGPRRDGAERGHTGPDACTGAVASPAAADGVIEIELPRGWRVRVSGSVKPAALRLVLDALERR